MIGALFVFLVVLGLIYLDRIVFLYTTVKSALEHDSLFELVYFESRIGRFVRKVASFFAIIILKPTSPFIIHILLDNLDQDFRARVFGTGLRSLIHPTQPISPEEAEALIVHAARRLAESKHATPSSECEGSPNAKTRLFRRAAVHAVSQVSGKLIDGGTVALPLGSMVAITLTNLGRNFAFARRFVHRMACKRISGSTEDSPRHSDSGHPLFLGRRSLLGLPFELQRVLVARTSAKRVNYEG